MRAVIQRVKEASVAIDNEIVGAIHQGFMILLGIHEDDTLEDVAYLTRKIAKLRVFSIIFKSLKMHFFYQKHSPTSFLRSFLSFLVNLFYK